MDEILQAMNDENDRLLADTSNKGGDWSDSVSIWRVFSHFVFCLLTGMPL